MTLNLWSLRLNLALKMEQETPTQTLSVTLSDLPNMSERQRSIFTRWQMGR
jgi:hypothetical protein